MSKQIPISDAKEIVLKKVAAGSKVKEAMAAVGRSYETWRDWRKNDPEFKRRTQEIREALDRDDQNPNPVPDFPEFAETYLRMPLPEHHLRIWDFLNGKHPRAIHQSMEVQWAEDKTARQIINIPPDHGKSTTWTVNWVTWQIVKNPDIRIIIVSKTQRLAKQFLLSVKQRLTNPLYEKMQAAFGPAGGWKDDNLPWREDMIYVRGRDAEEKDPTVQALGIRGAIYGARADLVILDDAEDLGNYGEYERHAEWVAQDVDSRIVPAEPGQEPGRLVIIGTRVGAIDLYRYLRDARPLDEDEPSYSYFKQPAILENNTSPNHEEWKVLWPERQTSKHIKKRRGAYPTPRQFQLIYQQDDVPEDSVFKPEAVRASINGQRYPGVMVPGATGHRDRGMDGLYVICGWDPASSAGRNAMVAIGIDKQTQKRWVLDCWNKKGALPRDSIGVLRDWTQRYRVNEWRIEKNAVQEFIVQLDEIRNFLASKGCRLVPHYTHGNKRDSEMGVESMSALWDTCVDVLHDGAIVAKPKGAGLVELPHAGKNPAVQEFANQLQAWEPDNKKQIQDLVMAYWFAELGVREYLRGGFGNKTHIESRFTSRRSARSRTVISIEDAHRQGLVNAI